MNGLKLYLASLAAFVAVDAVWLGLVAPGFYREHIGFMLRPDPDFLAAGVFYLLFVLGLQVFVIEPGVRSGSRSRTVLRAAFFGVVTYATYDLTNQATVPNWPVLVTVVDLAWGALLSATVSLVGFTVGRRLRPAGATGR